MIVGKITFGTMLDMTKYTIRRELDVRSMEVNKARTGQREAEIKLADALERIAELKARIRELELFITSAEQYRFNINLDKS